MAKDFSFDIVSDFDSAKMNNAVDQSKREMANRYDFKGTSANIQFNDQKTGVIVNGDNDFQIDSIIDIFRKKLAICGIDQKVLDIEENKSTSNMIISQKISFKKGLDQPKSKSISSKIRDSFPKVKATIQADTIRVSSSKKDELQGTMTLLKNSDFDFPISFTNFR